MVSACWSLDAIIKVCVLVSKALPPQFGLIMRDATFDPCAFTLSYFLQGLTWTRVRLEISQTGKPTKA